MFGALKKLCLILMPKNACETFWVISLRSIRFSSYKGDVRSSYLTTSGTGGQFCWFLCCLVNGQHFSNIFSTCSAKVGLDLVLSDIGNPLTLGRRALMRIARNTAWISSCTNKFEKYKASSVLWMWKSTAHLCFRLLMFSPIHIIEWLFGFLLWLSFEFLLHVSQLGNKMFHHEEHTNKEEIEQVPYPSDSVAQTMLLGRD